MFIVDVACGDGHSVTLSNDREVWLWGCNKKGQLGHDYESYPIVAQPRRLILCEYMNGGIKETFSAIKARADYTVLISDSKHVYLSCKKTDQPFNPLFGKPYNSKHCHMGVLKKLTDVYLSDSYLLAFDQCRSIYMHKIVDESTVNLKDFNSDRKYALEVYNLSNNFIELYPSNTNIWAINNLRQLLVCKDPHSEKNSGNLQFESVNTVFNVMSAAISDKHQVVLRMIKQLDALMVRDINIA